ncbi:MAG: tail fiber protein [Christensenella sp.]|uniref:phage tail protein n=1 Tax=Christensenella sp. TaxID=1935934 RepID=UPI002B21D2CF|nr:tail fiber protein [Christensenella sp.]MEA5002410.1 tail fiber protein [Christensenella sp.]
MAIQDLKFNEGEFAGKDVASLPDNPSVEGISATQLKARFDNIAKMMIALGKHNELIDALVAGTGAGEIGNVEIAGVSGTDVQATLEGLKALSDGNKTELLARIDERIPKTDIVQMRGRSKEQVMSQKAVTDAIDAGGGGGGGGSGEFEPVGCMKFFAGEALPDGYLWCDGASYPSNGVYAKLFGIVGTTYNQSGDAAGTFRVPDMRGRVGVGKNAETFDAVGKTGGEEKHTLSVAEMPEHNLRQVVVAGKANGAAGTKSAAGITNGDIGFSNTMQVIDSEWTNKIGGNQPHENMPPYLVCNYIIKFDRSYEQIGVTAPPVIWEIKQADWQVHAPGGYVLNIPESEHRRGEHCVLTALYDTTEAGKLKAVLFEMEKNETGDITIYSDTAFPGKAYIDRVYLIPAGRVLSVNGQTPDMDGDVDIFSKVSPSINMWQRRNGWVRLAIMASGMTLAHGDIFAQIVGDSGLVNAIAFVGTCMGTDGVTRQCIFNVNASGQISARNDNAVVMSRVAFDVTLPALNV